MKLADLTLAMVQLWLAPNGTNFGHDVGRNESCELRHRPTFPVMPMPMPMPELAALGPAYSAWLYDSLQ